MTKQNSARILVLQVFTAALLFTNAVLGQVGGASQDSASILVGYTPTEGFRLRSLDGNYMLRIGLRACPKAEFSWSKGNYDPEGIFSFLRPMLQGNIYKKWLRYLVSMELSQETPFLLDAFVDIQPITNFGFIFGQQGTPVSRHNSFGPQQIFFPDFSGVANYFWSGRERGLTLYGFTNKEWLNYEAGVYDGSPISQPRSNPLNYVVEGRLIFNPWGPVNANELPFTPEGKPLPRRLSFNAQGYFGKIQTTLHSYNISNSILTPVQTQQSERTGTVGADIWYQQGPLIVFGEYYWRRLTPIDFGNAFNSTGVWGQILGNIYKNYLGLGARVSWIDPNLSLSDVQSLEVEGQLAWFIHPTNLVLKLRYAWLNQDSPNAEALDGFILPYIAGVSQVTTLQLTLSF